MHGVLQRLRTGKKADARSAAFAKAANGVMCPNKNGGSENRNPPPRQTSRAARVDLSSIAPSRA